jgi:hypothetical protein
MNPIETQKRLEAEPDFVALKRFDYSLDKVLERYPNGCPTRIIAQALLMTEEEVEAAYERVVEKLRKGLGR